MYLYHGSNTPIETINLAMCRPYKDFGTGFYVTDLKNQAQKMAQRVARIYGQTPVVTIYEIEDDFLETPTLSIRNFGAHASEEWARFVMNNRSRTFSDFSDAECNRDNKYDIVIGPVADDDLALLFRQYQNELIDLDALVKGMTFKKLSSQYSFHTPNALHLLKKVGVIYE